VYKLARQRYWDQLLSPGRSFKRLSPCLSPGHRGHPINITLDVAGGGTCGIAGRCLTVQGIAEEPRILYAGTVTVHRPATERQSYTIEQCRSRFRVIMVRPGAVEVQGVCIRD